ncbi:MAG: SDR family oxidoreductase [Brachymonas sp.]|nr:SDR family oxidoreductase [Brachymonas sp.]
MNASGKQKTVLVTGGAHRLGAVLCRTFAESGWRVLCHYHRSEAAAKALQQEQQQQGHALELVQADLADANARAALMAQATQRWGPVHALVNNASLFLPDSGHNFAEAQALEQLRVNLLAPLDLARQLAQQHPTDAPAASACAIHILDQKVFNLDADYFSYTVSKLALERAVALQARALAPQLRVCGVAPGLMFESGPQNTQNFKVASLANLLRRPVEPADVARTCLFLAETPSITGTTICVDNGQHLVPLPRDIQFVVEDLLAPHLAYPSP